MRRLVTLSAALSGLMMLIVGGMVPSAMIIPNPDLGIKIVSLASTWQISALLLCSLVFTPKSAVIAVIAYIIIGIFYIPVFHGGGSTGYLMTADFGYLIGFIPSAVVTSNISLISQRKKFKDIIYICMIGLAIIHISGIINLILGAIAQRWPLDIISMLYTYSIAPLPFQLLLIPSIAIMAKILRLVLLR